MPFSATTHWIWTAGEPSPRNLWLRARRTFHCPTTMKKATIQLTADSRYEFFVNGEWIGAGPVRSYPWAHIYDTYDITSWLQAGQDNVLAVRVVHWGDYSFQYVRGRGGILCELNIECTDGQNVIVGSDDTWCVSPESALRQHTQRIAPQFGYEEHYDARLSDDAWLTTNYNEQNWLPATVIGPVGMAPWTSLSPRTIPFLTRDEVLPSRVVAAELAQTLPGPRWSFNLRYRSHPQPTGLSTDAQGEGGKALVTEIIAPYACTVTLHYVADYAWLNFSCNGEKHKGLTPTFTLQEGRNLFVAAGSAEWPTLHFATEVPLQFDASRIIADTHNTQTANWVYLAPFNERDDTMKQFFSAQKPEDLPTVPQHALYEHDNLATDIFLLTRTQRFSLPQTGFCDPAIDKPQPRQRIQTTQPTLIEQPSALLHHNGCVTTLHPQAEGDIHLIIEFEKLLIGYLTFEIDASADTIVDANMFEVIDDSGIFWTNLVHNSLRYTCREGRQTFRSTVRRGFRYVALTIRGATRPIHIHTVGCLFSTYPVEKRGNFSCSDTHLSKIHDISAYTVQLCMEDTYTDCPTYEQIFYVGDARNSSLINAFNFGAYDLTAHCLRLTAQSLSSQVDTFKKPHLKGMPHLTTGHVASGWYSVITMWTMMWFWNVWEHYELTGDLLFLQEIYPDVQECMRRCLLYLTERHLIDIPDVDNLVDWTPMDTPRNGETTSNSALLVESLRLTARMAETLAQYAEDAQALHEQAQHYLQQAKQTQNAINTYCWSEERGAYVDTVRDEVAYTRYCARQRDYGETPETYAEFLSHGRISQPTNTLVLRCHCAPADRAERILPLALLAESEDYANVEPGWKPSWTAEKLVPVGSPWFLFFTAETLTTYGHTDAAINMIRNQWGYMLSKGSTTFWEMFRFWTKEHWTRSMCHGWAGGPAYFLPALLLGIQPGKPGFQQVRIAPYHNGLTWARGTVPSPHGDIHVNWTRNDQQWEITIDLPTNVPGELRIATSEGQMQYVRGDVGEIVHDGETWCVTLPAGARTTYVVSKN